MANIVTTEVITEALNGRSVLLSDKLSSDYTTMTEDQILNGTGVAAMVSDIKKNTAFGNEATALYGGGAVGSGARSGAAGFAGGQGANEVYGSGAAVGQGAKSTVGSGAVGWRAESNNGGGAVGSTSYSTAGGAVGAGAVTSDGAAVGRNAKCLSGDTKIDAIQLGTGTNSTAGSMQVYSTPLLIPDGNGGLVIPLSLIKASYEAASTDDQNAFKAALGIS